MDDIQSIILTQVEKRVQELEDRRQQLSDLVVDITPAERDKFRKRAGEGVKGFWFFAKKVFPEYFPSPFSSMHKDIVAFATSKKRVVFVVAGPPEHGKTTLMRVFKIWAAIYGYHHYIIKVTETMDLTLMDMRSIKLEFESNPRLIFLYGNLSTYGSWEDSRFQIAATEFNKDGTLFEAFAFGVPPTGRVWKQFRPDLCDIDDLENYRRSANKTISEEKLQFINNDIIPRMKIDAPIIWFGNNARKTMAMNIIIEMNKRDREHDYPAFEIHVYPAWDRKNKRPLWHERFNYKSEQEMRVAFGLGSFTWNGNYMQQPLVADGSTFKNKFWKEYTTLPKDATGIVWCDPAPGKKNCFKVAVPIFFSRSTLKFYIPNCFVRQSDWEPYFESMYKFYELYFDRITYFVWESNFFQDQYLQFKKLYNSLKGKPNLPIKPIETKTNKNEDILSFSVPFENGDVVFHKDFKNTQDGIEGHDQLIGYPDYAFNDFPDAVARGYKHLFALVAGIIGSDKGSQREMYRQIEARTITRDVH